MLRQRATSAVILVPPLLIALLLGGPWIVLVVAVAAGLAARGGLGLLAAAGDPGLPWVGLGLAVALILDVAAAPAIDRNGGLMLAIGTILAAVGAFLRT